MKTEDELLDLIAKTHGHGDVGYIKDCLAENVIWCNENIEMPAIGKENVCAKIQHWFQYNRNFNVWVDAIVHPAEEASMGYVSLANDYDEIHVCVVIESKDGLITRYYEVNPENTGRRLFQTLKKKVLEPRILKATDQQNTKIMTLQEINSKYSFAELQKMPADDAEFRRNLFSPFLTDLYENKIIYYERFACVAIVKDIIITPELFEITAVPYLKLKSASGSGGKQYYPNESWTFSASWAYMRLLGDNFGTYGGWLFWTDKELVKTVEELAIKKEFEAALNLTVYKGWGNK